MTSSQFHEFNTAITTIRLYEIILTVQLNSLWNLIWKLWFQCFNSTAFTCANEQFLGSVTLKSGIHDIKIVKQSPLRLWIHHCKISVLESAELKSWICANQKATRSHFFQLKMKNQVRSLYFPVSFLPFC